MTLKLASSGGSFSLQIKLEHENLSAQSITPNEEQTVPFVVLMRRFLGPSDPLYFKTVWTCLQEQFKEELPNGATEAVNSFIERMNQGEIGINIDGKDVTAEEIYQTISSGVYFDNDVEIEKYLHRLTK